MTREADPLPPAARAWLLDVLGPDGAVRGARPLAGATSTTVLAVDAERQGGALALVLRLVDNEAWRAEEPDLAAHEAAALAVAARSGVPVPELVAVDENGAACGVPAVLMTRLPGVVDLGAEGLEGRLERLARALAAIHAVPAGDHPWRYASWTAADALTVPAWATRPALWERAIARVRAGPPTEPERFLHRDFHPVNTLWRGGRLRGVVDWVNACRGPAGVDLAHGRTNLALMYGPPAADLYLDRYRDAVPDYEHDPYWDLDSVLGFTPEGGPYPPWATFGLRGLTPELLAERAEALLAGAVARL